MFLPFRLTSHGACWRFTVKQIRQLVPSAEYGTKLQWYVVPPADIIWHQYCNHYCTLMCSYDHRMPQLWYMSNVWWNWITWLWNEQRWMVHLLHKHGLTLKKNQKTCNWLTLGIQLKRYILHTIPVPIILKNENNNVTIMATLYIIKSGR